MKKNLIKNKQPFVFLKKLHSFWFFLFLMTPVLSYSTQENENPTPWKIYDGELESLKLDLGSETTREIGISEPEKQNYPYFWQIEKDGKKSYILGTIHEGIGFEELLYHEDITAYLRSADFLLKEISQKESELTENEPRLLTERTRNIINELEQLIKNSMSRDYKNEFSNLNEQEQKFLLELWIESYFSKHGSYPNLEDLKSSFFYPHQLQKLIKSSGPRVDIQGVSNNGKRLDTEIEEYFLQHKKSRSVNPPQEELAIENLLISSLQSTLEKSLGESYNTFFPNGFKPERITHRNFTSSLDDYETRQLIDLAKRSLITMEDIKEWIKNYSKRFSEETIKEILNYKLYHFKEYLSQFLSGEITLKESFYHDREKYFLETELRQATIDNILLLDFRNQLWIPKIVEAFEQHNSVFIVAGLAHFINRERNPFNIPELEEYTRQNKNLPTNVLDMLKNEGFKITRFGEGDFVPASSCQTAFL